MLRYFTKALFVIVFFITTPSYLSAKYKSPQSTICPVALYLGLDLAKICYAWYQKTGNSYEITGSIDFKSILFHVDYGFSTIKRDGRQEQGSFSYTNGNYCRLGLGYNFLTPTLHHNRLFIGLSYARSFFYHQLKSDKLQCNHQSTQSCGDTCIPVPISLQNLSGAGIAHWWEFVVGGGVYLLPMVSIGCTARYKFGKKIENKLAVLPFDIPGFGLNEFEDAFGYSVYILMRIPLQKRSKSVSKVESYSKKI